MRSSSRHNRSLSPPHSPSWEAPSSHLPVRACRSSSRPTLALAQRLPKSPPSTRLRAGGNTATPSAPRPFPALRSRQALNLAAPWRGDGGSPIPGHRSLLSASQSGPARARGKRAPPGSPSPAGEGKAAGQDGLQQLLGAAPPAPFFPPAPLPCPPAISTGEGAG